MDVDVDVEPPLLSSAPSSAGGDDDWTPLPPTPTFIRLSKPVSKLVFTPGDFFSKLEASKDRER